MLATMFVHSIPEGIAIGVGYATGELEFGLLLALAIAVHNVPEGIAISLPLARQGRLTAALYDLRDPDQRAATGGGGAGLPARRLLPAVAALRPRFAGGAMMFLVAAELIPESLDRSTNEETAWGIMAGLALMLLITASLSRIATS